MSLLPFRTSSTATATATAAAPRGLNEMLLDLARYGKPRVSMLSEGWFASIEMNTNTTGTSFEVQSDFGAPTPEAAVSQCMERVHAALKALGSTQ